MADGFIPEIANHLVKIFSDLFEIIKCRAYENSRLHLSPSNWRKFMSLSRRSSSNSSGGLYARGGPAKTLSNSDISHELSSGRPVEARSSPGTASGSSRAIGL